MHFSKMNDNGSGKKGAKIAAVAVFHVLAAMAFIHSMNTRTLTMPKLPDDLVVMFAPEAPKPPPPPPEPPTVKPKTAPAPVFKPVTEVPVEPTEVPVIATTSVPDPAPLAPVAPAQPEAAPAAPANSGVMHTAVLADANACAKPDYPVRAARMGETGTVTLALLVGVDGKVTGSKVQKSSGSKDLDRAAVSALSLCKFKPATNNGVPEQAWGQIAYVWTLEQ